MFYNYGIYLSKIGTHCVHVASLRINIAKLRGEPTLYFLNNIYSNYNY
jgi:hypothetical protein